MYLSPYQSVPETDWDEASTLGIQSERANTEDRDSTVWSEVAPSDAPSVASEVSTFPGRFVCISYIRIPLYSRPRMHALHISAHFVLMPLHSFQTGSFRTNQNPLLIHHLQGFPDGL